MTTTTTRTFKDRPLDILKLLTPNLKELLLGDQEPGTNVLSPAEVLETRYEEYQKDIEHLFLTIATQYTDVSCVHLHTDELMGESRLKFSKLLDDHYFDVCPTRKDFFARLKTVINNHVKGLVQRYRFTIKRTGIKPPPKGQVPTTSEDFRSTKPVEISLDDPDSLLQVSEPEASQSHDDEELATEFRRVLTPLEQLVFDQLVSPNDYSNILADHDSERGGKPGSIRVNFKKSHLADGIGLDVDTFCGVERSVKKKYQNFMDLQKDPEMQQQEAEFSAALTLLCEAFGLQIPRGIEYIIIRRALTLAARRNYDKLTEPVKGALLKIGAKLPSSNGLSLNCLGVLFDSNNKICSVCGHRDRCRVEASTIGLDKIIPHPTVLGVRQMRIPTLITEAPPQPPAPNDRNDGILSYLNETFAQSVINRDTFYRHREASKGERPPQLFCVITSKPSEQIQLRFCNPGEQLREKLEKRRNGWYLPDTASVDEAILLVEQHSSEVLSQETQEVS